MARFKTDENLPLEVADLLRAHGYDALTINDQRMSGASDPNIAEVCQQEGRTLITLDLDFADIRCYPPASHSGMIVLRLRRTDKLALLAVTRRLIALLDQETVAGSLWIVDEARVRIRT
jgi:predicted nuclease of predicted toxin-antitoxin system